MKASLFAQMGYAERHKFPATWPVPPSYHDPAVTMQSYEDGLQECVLAEEMGFDWISCSEHHYSGNRLTPNPAVMAAAVSQRCKKVRIALLGQLLQHHNPVRAAEEIGMLDNLTGGRVIMAFLRGIPQRGPALQYEPGRRPSQALRGHGPAAEGPDRAPALLLGRALLPIPHRVGLPAAGAAASAAGDSGDQE